jgi:hypothetical protein
MTETPDRIQMVEARPHYHLIVTYDKGQRIEVDLGDMVRRGGVFKTLQDERMFSRVRIGSVGDKVEWPEPKDDFGEPIVDIDAESLWYLHAGQQRLSAMQRLIAYVERFLAREPARAE